MRVRAKICGITRLEDAERAVVSGADALGFNFHRPSPRYISPERAMAIVAAMPPFVTCVGLFVDAPIDEVRAVATMAGVALLQFQGDESDAQCAGAGYPYVKAIRVSGPIDVNELERRYPRARALLFDTWKAGHVGGTGESFDWSWWPRASSKPLVLAGGLTPGSVGDAIVRTRPFAVDVCTGVEGATKGIKDSEKLEHFMFEVRRVQQRI